MKAFRLACLFLAIASAATTATATDWVEARVEIQSHRFVPGEVRVPAGRKVRLTIVNNDASAEEFESYELNREKVVAANGRIIVFVGPLKPGKYPFFGDFHPDTAKGSIVAE